MEIITLIVIVLIIGALFAGGRREKEGYGCGCLGAILEAIGALTLLATCGACS
jgi:TRAP-type mannitol/chloroaromatic compound transport system permease large subunit